jgi:hypothetical protein
MESSQCHAQRRAVVLCVILVFHRDIDESYAVLEYYAALGGSSVPTFRDNLSVPTSRVKNSSWRLKTEPIICPETSVRNCHSMLRNIPEERVFQVWYWRRYDRTVRNGMRLYWLQDWRCHSIYQTLLQSKPVSRDFDRRVGDSEAGVGTPVWKSKHTPGLKTEQLCGMYWLSILQLYAAVQNKGINSDFTSWGGLRGKAKII